MERQRHPKHVVTPVWIHQPEQQHAGLFGIALAGIVVIVTFMQLGILWACAVIAAGIFILTIQLYSTFLGREF